MSRFEDKLRARIPLQHPKTEELWIEMDLSERDALADVVEAFRDAVRDLEACAEIIGEGNLAGLSLRRNISGAPNSYTAALARLDAFGKTPD